MVEQFRGFASYIHTKHIQPNRRPMMLAKTQQYNSIFYICWKLGYLIYSQFALKFTVSFYIRVIVISYVTLKQCKRRRWKSGALGTQTNNTWDFFFYFVAGYLLVCSRTKILEHASLTARCIRTKINLVSAVRDEWDFPLDEQQPDCSLHSNKNQLG
jgi:hypothetical protein